MHSDLGRIEWKDSLPTCERLADLTGLELLVVRREKGDMVDRWKQRWTDNLATVPRPLVRPAHPSLVHAGDAVLHSQK